MPLFVYICYLPIDAYMQEAYLGSYRQSSLGECIRTIINSPLFLQLA
jgi:hypothetical protein